VIWPGVPLEVLLAGTEFDISLAATLLAKLVVVIVFTLAAVEGLTKTNTLSFADRVLATGKLEIFISAIIK
jgi:hypothetical protein